LTANAPIAKTLRPCREESVDFDTTKNLFIEGDNLDALKLLQETYLGKVKMIYIDPPYNTGNDFIYEDDFAENADEFLLRSNQKDDEGNRLVANTESNGRFHSDWLSMIYPRLKLAKKLLSDDGVIFISIGDEELSCLKQVCNEVFGEANYRNTIAIKRGAKSVQAQFDKWDKLGTAFEYILLYSKQSMYRFPKMERELYDFKSGTWNNHWRGTDRPTMRYEIFGIIPESGQWRWSKERSFIAIKNYQRLLSDVGKNEQNLTQEDIDNWYSTQNQDTDLLRLSSTKKPEHFIPPTNSTLLNDVWFHIPSGGSSIVKQLMGFKAFDNPKPLGLIRQACLFCSDDAIILDFFAGSSTTAHAVMQLNAEDGGNRKFIMVQLPELCNEQSEAFKAGYETIAEISKERIRRAGKKIKDNGARMKDEESTLFSDSDNSSFIPHPSSLDVGFRVLKVDSSNMAEVYYTPDAVKQEELFNAVDNIKPDRTPEDLLFQVLLDLSVDLSLPIRKMKIEIGMVNSEKKKERDLLSEAENSPFTIHNSPFKTYEVFFVDENALIACFDTGVSEELVKELAQHKPLRVVFRDTGFTTDTVKINVDQIFKQLSPGTEVKSI